MNKVRVGDVHVGWRRFCTSLKDDQFEHNSSVQFINVSSDKSGGRLIDLAAFCGATVSSDGRVSDVWFLKYCVTVTYRPFVVYVNHKKNKKNSTAYVDNQINTNVLYTIRYKKGKKAHESISGS